MKSENITKQLKHIKATNKELRADDINALDGAIRLLEKGSCECDEDHKILKAYSDGQQAALEEVRKEMDDIKPKTDEGKNVLWTCRAIVDELMEDKA